MLNTLSAWFASALISLLALLQSVAGVIDDTITTVTSTILTVPETHTPTPLPSQYSTDAIPDILLRDPQYQRAGVIDSLPTQRVYTTDTAAALVNILCTHTTNRMIRTTTGSGFFIEPRGVILTNAHVAQFLLLETLEGFGETDCVIRTGNPANDRYQAELLYLPPSWIQEYAAAIVQDRPVGTGERDYALLYVSASRTGEPLPAHFPALAFDTDLLSVHTITSMVTAAGYPASKLLRTGREIALPSQIATTTVTDLFTFGSNYADVMALAGSAVGSFGSSGGPVLNESGKVVGLITTKGNDAVDGPGSLRAITLSYIDRTIKQETGFDLTASIGGDLAFRARIFQETLAPFLSAILARELTMQRE